MVAKTATRKTVKKKAAPKKRAPVKKQTQLVCASDLPPDFEVEVPIETALIPYEERQQEMSNQVSPIEQMKQMREMGVGVDDMAAMLQLQKDYEANEALKAFNSALALFKAEDLSVFKKGKVGYENSDGSTTGYSHAKLEDIDEVVVPFLSKHGFSHRWKTTQTDGGMTKVTFVLTHSLGHSEETSLQAGLDQSGGKNNIQALGSTVSYLERYTMLAGTGIAVKDMDDDGAGADDGVDCVSEDELANLNALMDEVNVSSIDFAAHCRVDCMENLPASKYKGAVRALESKR